MLGYTSPRPAIGERATWSQHFKNAGYYTARVSKIYHMGVPGGIEEGGDGADDPASWTERFNSPGPEWKAPGAGETLEGNPDGKKPVVGGNTFVVVEADGDDLVHSDGKTAAKAVELIGEARRQAILPGRRFRAAARAVRCAEEILRAVLALRQAAAADQSAGRLGRHSQGRHQLQDQREHEDGPPPPEEGRRRLLRGGGLSWTRRSARCSTPCEKSGQADNTIVIFTSDHGYHLGEHDFWAKVSLHDESAMVPLIIRVPGKKPAVCHSLVELLDLYPTVASLCGLEVPARLQGKDISRMFDDPQHTVRDAAFCVAPSSKGFLLREDKWAYIQYGEDASQGIELFDMAEDPKQYTNLAARSEFADVVKDFQAKLAAKLRAVRDNDLQQK